MKIVTGLFCVFSLVLSLTCKAQASLASDSLYYKSWPGRWYRFEDNKMADDPSFVVKQALYESSFEEGWIEEGFEEIEQKAWRAWDSRSKKWDFAWMAADGLFQIWEGKKVDDKWYMYKWFAIDEQNVLSRQAFVLQGDSTMIRTSEHSLDNGNTWKLRFREVYKKR